MASTYMDVAAGSAALKVYYDNQKLNWLVYKNFPFLALVPKNENMRGAFYPVPVLFATSQSANANFQNAQSNQVPAQLVQFQMTRKSHYALFSVTNEAMLASEGDAAAFMSLLTTAVDGGIRDATLALASMAFRAGTGSIGQISSISAGVVTLVNIVDAHNFEVGKVIAANATDGGATPRAAVGYVINVDRIAGTVTVSATAQGGSAGSPTGWTANDFLLVSGNNNALISGVLAWCPTSAPSSTDNFYGVNRSQDTRLRGLPLTTNQATEEALVDSAVKLAEFGSTPDYVFLPFPSYSGLQKALSARIQYLDIQAEDAEIAFRSILIQGPTGPIRVIADRFVPQATAFMVDLATWKLGSINKAPHILEYRDTHQLLRIVNADAMEGRVGLYGNLWTNAPVFNSNIALSQ